MDRTWAEWPIFAACGMKSPEIARRRGAAPGAMDTLPAVVVPAADPTLSTAPVAAPLTIEQSMRHLGALVGIERTCFEIVGRWTLDIEAADPRIAASTVARHHAWRAGQLRERLPREGPFAADVVIGAPRAWLRVFDDLARFGDVSLRAYAHVVVPRLALGYRAHLRRSTGPADHEVARTLAACLADLQQDRLDVDAIALEAGSDAAAPTDGRSLATRGGLLIGEPPVDGRPAAF